MRVEKLAANLDAVSTGMRQVNTRQDGPLDQVSEPQHGRTTPDQDNFHPDFMAHTRRFVELED
jgi:hypothetical protein